jgi:hypothetical protein
LIASNSINNLERNLQRKIKTDFLPARPRPCPTLSCDFDYVPGESISKGNLFTRRKKKEKVSKPKVNKIK